MRGLLMAVAMGVALATPLGAESPISLLVSPQVAPEGGNVVLMIRIPEHPDNRWALVQWDGPIAGSTVLDLLAFPGQRTWRLDKAMINLRAGRYSVVALLERSVEGKAKSFSSGVKTVLVGPQPEEN